MSDWKAELDNIFEKKNKDVKEKEAQRAAAKNRINEFIKKTVLSAFNELKPELEKHGQEVEILVSDEMCSIHVNSPAGQNPFNFTVGGREGSASPTLEVEKFGSKTGKMYKTTNSLSDNTFENVTIEEVRKKFLHEYKDYLSR